MLDGKLTTTFREGVEIFFPPLYPVLTALVSRIYGNTEVAAVLVSAVTGTGTVFAVWWLGRMIFGVTVAWIAGILSALNPVLIHWSAHMLTDSLFAAIAVTAAAVGWRAIQTGSSRWWFAAGLLCSLTYLTRVIGLSFLPAIGIWASYSWKPSNRKCRQSFAFLLTFIFGFLAISLPYWIYLRVNLGDWTISGSYPAASEIIGQGGNPDWGEGRRPPEAGGRHGLAARIGQNATDYATASATTFSLSLVFAAMSLVNRPRRDLPPIPVGPYYLTAIIAGYLVALLLVGGVPFRGERSRYLSPLIPFILVLASGGLIRLADWIGHVRTIVILSALTVILSSFWIQISSVPGLYFFPVWKPLPPSPQRTFGIWMKEHLQPPLAIIARKPYIPYFAEGVWYVTPATIEEVVKVAKERHVEYLVVDRASDTRSRPEVATLLEPHRAGAAFELVAVQRYPDGRVMMALYKINPT